ncbi:MAG: TauD/TfdA family dioxygenase [Rhodobacteraceae bacterium]|nr:TauD/TfdA family dioxygenase [Paracoccaceae bacterium]
MTVTEIAVAPEALTLHWNDGQKTVLPSIWLRDNCPSGLHAETGERVFDLLSVEAAPKIDAAALQGQMVQVDWAGGHQSHYSHDWLTAHRPGQKARDLADIAPVLWRRNMAAGELPRQSAQAIMEDDTALGGWMKETARYGLSIIEGLPDDIGAGVAAAERVGFLRSTNFGEVFEVMSKPDPNNLAYTSHALPLHTDLPNQEIPPGFQFLHCLANEAEGGGSVFADGFAIAEHIRAEDPRAFHLLAETEIPFRFHDRDTDIRVYSPVIVLDRAGRLREIRYNAHLAAVFDMPAEQMPTYYQAYRKYMALTRDPAFQLTLRLQAGEMVVFDNRRALHGREAFDPSTGFRHLHGCYVDRGEFSSRLRVLARAS